MSLRAKFAAVFLLLLIAPIIAVTCFELYDRRDGRGPGRLGIRRRICASFPPGGWASRSFEERLSYSVTAASTISNTLRV
jgi:hypothetical protein